MLKTHYFKSNLQSIAQHAINQVSVPISKSKQLKVLKPSYIEQGKVKRFLNDQTSEIDSLVSDKKKLIELLEEKRQTVITETVTKGLDPTVKMKDSGVEWIGDIPEHWEVTKLKHISELTMGQSPDIKYINDNPEGVPFLQGNAEFTDKYPKAKHYCVKPTKLAVKGDILMSVRAPVGAMNWSDRSYVIGRGL